jgi:hypothetical protein
MPDPTLLTMANEIRGKTLRLLDGVPPDAARYTGPGLSNSVLWHAGHALMLVEHLCIVPATGGAPQYPQGWFEMFAWNSRPATVPPGAWPALADVVERLKEQLDRLRHDDRGPDAAAVGPGHRRRPQSHAPLFDRPRPPRRGEPPRGNPSAEEAVREAIRSRNEPGS